MLQYWYSILARLSSLPIMIGEYSLPYMSKQDQRQLLDHLVHLRVIDATDFGI